MKIAVCVKQIPDPAEPTSFDPETHLLDRSGKIVLDESDAYGVEMALQLVAEAGSGEVVVLSMAAEGETAGIRTALAMGADEAVVVSDPALSGSDALTTAKVLAAAAKTTSADIILTGTESSDGYSGTVPEQIAGVLGLPSVTFAKAISSATDSTLLVERQTTDGHDVVRCPTPCVISVTAGVVTPRYPSFKGIRAAKSKPVAQLSLSDLGLSEDLLRTRQRVRSVSDADARSAGQVIVDDGEAHEAIVVFLEQSGVL